MTERMTSSIEMLLRTSSDDEVTLAFPIPDAAFGFHARQAVEQVMKVLLVARTGSHPSTHDLVGLRKRIEKTGMTLPVCAFPIEHLAEYAGNARYEQPLAISAGERAVIRECIVVLRAFVTREANTRGAEAPGE